MKQESGMFPQQIDGLHDRQWSFELITAGICGDLVDRTWCASCVYTKIVNWRFLTVACARWQKLPSLTAAFLEPKIVEAESMNSKWIVRLSGVPLENRNQFGRVDIPTLRSQRMDRQKFFVGLDLGGTARPWELLSITCCPCTTSNGWLSTPRKRSPWRLFASPSSPAWATVLPGTCG